MALILLNKNVHPEGSSIAEMHLVFMFCPQAFFRQFAPQRKTVSLPKEVYLQHAPRDTSVNRQSQHQKCSPGSTSFLLELIR